MNSFIWTNLHWLKASVLLMNMPTDTRERDRTTVDVDFLLKCPFKKNLVGYMELACPQSNSAHSALHVDKISWDLVSFFFVLVYLSMFASNIEALRHYDNSSKFFSWHAMDTMAATCNTTVFRVCFSKSSNLSTSLELYVLFTWSHTCLLWGQLGPTEFVYCLIIAEWSV